MKSANFTHFLKLCVFIFIAPKIYGRSISSECAIEDLEFEYEEELSDVYTVAWNVDIDARNVTFRVTAKTLGWVGFGISPSAGHYGADMVIGGVDENEESYFDDRHVVNRLEEPEIDDLQNWDLLCITEDIGLQITTLEFRRAINTGDKEHDIKIPYRDINIIWAIGESDAVNQTSHLLKGTKTLNILDGYEDEPTTTEIPQEATSTATAMTTLNDCNLDSDQSTPSEINEDKKAINFTSERIGSCPPATSTSPAESSLETEAITETTRKNSSEDNHLHSVLCYLPYLVIVIKLILIHFI